MFPAVVNQNNMAEWAVIFLAQDQQTPPNNLKNPMKNCPLHTKY